MVLQTTTQRGDRTLFLLLWAAALLLFCLDLNGVPLRDWDEGTVAQVAREISRGETWTAWVHPQLFGQPYLNKPPLLHWLMAGTFRLWGVHTWTARLPGAVLTASSVPLLFLLGRQIFLTCVPAVMGALVYLTLMPVVRHGRLAMLDGAIVCFFIATLWMLLKARRSPSWYGGVGLGFGLMCLTKGILGILLMAIALLFLLWDKPKDLRSRALWISLLLGAVPVITWYGLQWQYYGQSFWEIGLVNQSFSRLWTSVDQHQAPPWYYLLELLKYSWPWLIFWPTGIWLTWRSRHWTWAKLILVWTLVYLLTISVMGTKLPWYIFPLYPAIALACGVALTAAWEMHRHWSGRSLTLKRLPRYWGYCLMLFSLLGAAGLVYASPWGGEPSVALGCTFTVVLLTTGAAAIALLRQHIRFIPMLFGGLYVALLCFVASDHWVWELGEAFPVLPVADLVKAQVPPDQPVYIAFPYNRPSLDFYSDRRVIAQSPDDLQTHWRQTAPVYLLVPDITPYQNTASPLTPLGATADWHLITNRTQPPS
jgi:4-amino-4-deoxy-L-arabinose transferase-like glycosyltransferase